MPISIRRDVAPYFGRVGSFALTGQPMLMPTLATYVFHRGSYLDFIRPILADVKWQQFYNSWGLNFPDLVQRNIAREIASKFNLNGRDDAFNTLFTFANDARAFEKHQRDDIEKALDTSYQHAAALADGRRVEKPTFERDRTIADDKIVVFSDVHMTALDTLPSYFEQFNYDLYVDVLGYYAGRGFTVVENGDVEDCLLFDAHSPEADARAAAAPRIPFGASTSVGAPPTTIVDPDSGLTSGHYDYPIGTGAKWRDFMKLRYDKRSKSQQKIFDRFPRYYDLLREQLIPYGRYQRLTGNHDTYLDQPHEDTLLGAIKTQLPGVEILDALRVTRDGQIRYLVTHGHQFDTVCLQHGSIPYAKSLGEVYSECVSWAYQGAERVWKLYDTRKWFNGDSYSNVLAREVPGTYQGGGDGQWDLLFSDLNRIKADPRDFIETLLGHEIGWEYFENSDGFEAFALEVWTGDEAYKLRSVNEMNLVDRYVSEFLDLQKTPTGGVDFSVPIPKLICGHTHEPRQNAVFPTDSGEKEPWERNDTGRGAYYLNSGSAGRYENLVWGIEIVGNEDRVVSWSRIDGALTKITWRSDGNRLRHDRVEVVQD